MVRSYDCRHYVSAEGRTRLEQKFFLGVDIKPRAVGGKAGIYFYGNPGEENNLVDIIKIKDRSLEEFNSESLEFRNYLDNTGKVHKG